MNKPDPIAVDPVKSIEITEVTEAAAEAANAQPAAAAAEVAASHSDAPDAEPVSASAEEAEKREQRKRLSPAERRKRRRKKRLRLILLWSVFLISAAVLIFCIVAIIFTAIERKAAREQYTQMQSLYEIAEPEATDPAAEPTPVETPDPSKWYAADAHIADKRIDFPSLQQRNADVCAWITVEGTSIDYPVLKAEGTDVLYLSHDIDGNASEHGAICLDVRSSRDFSDRVTLIYGHNMKDGSMFAPLYQYYRDLDFFNAGHRVKIYVDNVVLTYRVVAAYEYSYAHPLFYYRMNEDDDFQAYCATFLENRDMKAHIAPATIGPEDHVLTMITSTNVRADMRLFVQAVLEHGEYTTPAS